MKVGIIVRKHLKMCLRCATAKVQSLNAIRKYTSQKSDNTNWLPSDCFGNHKKIWKWMSSCPWSQLLSVPHSKGHIFDFLKLMRLIATDAFPLDSICFLLVLHLARWYSLPRLRYMTYSDATSLFWRVGHKTFLWNLHSIYVRRETSG